MNYSILLNIFNQIRGCTIDFCLRHMLQNTPTIAPTLTHLLEWVWVDRSNNQTLYIYIYDSRYLLEYATVQYILWLCLIHFLYFYQMWVSSILQQALQ